MPISADAVQGFGTVTVDSATADFLKALAGETRRKVMQQFTGGIELMTLHARADSVAAAAQGALLPARLHRLTGRAGAWGGGRA